MDINIQALTGDKTGTNALDDVNELRFIRSIEIEKLLYKFYEIVNREDMDQFIIEKNIIIGTFIFETLIKKENLGDALKKHGYTIVEKIDYDGFESAETIQRVLNGKMFIGLSIDFSQIYMILKTRKIINVDSTSSNVSNIISKKHEK